MHRCVPKRRNSGLRWASALGALALWVCLPVLDLASAAEDVVYLAGSSGRPGARLTGQIVDYTGRELRLRTITGQERVFPAARVARVSTERSQQHVQADRLMAARQYPQAIEQYRAALEADRENRNWVRRQFIAQMVWCYRAVGQPDQAGEYFLILLASDGETLHFDCIPLAWISQEPGAALEQKAAAWLARQDSPVANLMGASHLLASPRRSQAIERLNALAASADTRVASLARAQLWRTKSLAAGAAKASAWRKELESVPEPLRAGPYFVLGSALASTQPDEGALALLRVPICYPRERRLSAAALLASAACLEKLRSPQDAQRLYRELTQQHPESLEAAEASRRLEAQRSDG